MTDTKKIKAWMLVLMLGMVRTLKANLIVQAKISFACHRKEKKYFR